MYEINVDQFRVRPPWRDASFWMALTAALLAVLPTEARGWITAHQIALAPVVAWLLIHGYVRAKSAEALGTAVAGSRYVDVHGDHRIAHSVTETD